MANLGRDDIDKRELKAQRSDCTELRGTYGRRTEGRNEEGKRQ